MNRKIAIGVLTAALLVSGLLVGVSHGGSAEITQPEVLELRFKDRHIEYFPMYRENGKWGGQATFLTRLLFDVDGNHVGIQRVDCMGSADRGWICTSVSTLRDGPHTDKGTIVSTGIYTLSPSAQYHTYAVTGGTGAYDNVGGRMRQENRTYTLYLVP
jgi:hypothetical protein